MIERVEERRKVSEKRKEDSQNERKKGRQRLENDEPEQGNLSI